MLLSSVFLTRLARLIRFPGDEMPVAANEITQCAMQSVQSGFTVTPGKMNFLPGFCVD